jgi:hypothetical protein
MIAATNYVGTVDGELVVHLAVSPAFHQGGCYRASRLAVAGKRRARFSSWRG